MTFLVSVLGTALGIGLLIFVHQLGHYLAARAAKVRVEVFSLGFGPRLWGFVRGDTDYRIAAIPLGGYVKVAGDDPLERRTARSDELYSKGYLARGVFYAGGIAMNLLFALIAFPIVFGTGVRFTAPVIGSVTPGGAAWTAGLQKGDRVLTVAGKAMYSFENMVVEFALAGGRDPVSVEFERDGQRHQVSVTPRYSASDGIFSADIGEPVEDGPAAVGSVEPGSSAAQAGIRAGDRVIAFDGDPVTADQLNDRVSAVRIGTRFKLGVLRDGAPHEFTVTTGSAPRDRPQIGVRGVQSTVVALRPTPAVRVLGIAEGDRILAVDGKPFSDRELDLSGVSAGALHLQALRDGKVIELSAELDAAGRADLARSVALGITKGSVVVSPVEGSPAAGAGIAPGDVIRRAAGREIGAWDELLTVVHDAGTAPIAMTVESRDLAGGSSLRDITVTPRADPLVDPGFQLAVHTLRETVRADGFGDAMKRGVIASGDMIKQVYVTLKRMITGDVSARNVSGIVGISVFTYQQAKRGWTELLHLLAALSVNLAIVNLLPIPLFDGGHLLFLLIERVRGTPVSARVLNYSQVLGLVFVLALVVFVTFNDIRRLFFS